MGFKPTQLKHQLCASIQYRNRLLRLKVSWLLCSYYRRHARDFAAIARPLHQLTEKTKEFHWNPEAHKAFEQLKDCLTSTPNLAFPSMNEPFILYTDASQFAIGAVLAQVQNDLERVICYASKSLNKAQSRYSTTKRKLLAIVNYTRHFKHYLLGQQFKIITDHRALQWLHNFKEPDALTARWLEKLAALIMRLNTKVMDALDMPTVCHDSRHQPPLST